MVRKEFRLALLENNTRFLIILLRRMQKLSGSSMERLLQEPLLMGILAVLVLIFVVALVKKLLKLVFVILVVLAVYVGYLQYTGQEVPKPLQKSLEKAHQISGEVLEKGKKALDEGGKALDELKKLKKAGEN
jgi:hypothetical protein